jgi:hypothetical protein
MFPVEPPFVFLHQSLGRKYILQFATDALPYFANKVALPMMALQFLIVFIVDVLEFGAVQIAYLAFEMRAHF